LGEPSYFVTIVTSLRTLARCRERIARLGESTLDSESIRREAIAELQRTIGFDRWCWPLADPDTLLPLSGLAEHDYGPRLPRALELEFSGHDFAAKHVLARRATGTGSLSAETGGDLGRSARWDEVMRPVGIGDIAAVACRDALGCWGWIEVYRDAADRPFDEAELELLASAGARMGSPLRRTSTASHAGGAPEPSLPGVLVLGPDLSVANWTAGAQAWIDALPAAALFRAWGILPPVAYPVATLARTPLTATSAHALERTVDGRWLMIEAALLEGDDEGRVVVTLRGATPSETFVLLCRTFALTRRERNVVAGIIGGLDTRALSERLFISRHTVQDHLKSVFEKVGIHSRRELLATFNAPDGRG
jgi:DNA-binding CsgD family transcriptional regulator